MTSLSQDAVPTSSREQAEAAEVELGRVIEIHVGMPASQKAIWERALVWRDRWVAEARRQALEEAMKATCMWCERGIPYRGGGYHRRHNLKDHRTYDEPRCTAAAIRGLLVPPSPQETTHG